MVTEPEGAHRNMFNCAPHSASLNIISHPESIIKKEEERDFELSASDKILYKTRYFTDSGIIGSKEFVKKYYDRFKSFFTSQDKEPKVVKGLTGIYSLKRLSENVVQ